MAPAPNEAFSDAKKKKSIKLEKPIFLNLQQHNNLIGLDEQQQAPSYNQFFFFSSRDDKIIMGKQSQLNYECIRQLVNILSRREFGGIENPGPSISVCRRSPGRADSRRCHGSESL